MMAPSEDMRVVRQWRGRSAQPVRLAIRLESLSRSNSITSDRGAGFSLYHGAERNRISWRGNRRDAVLPDMPGRARHQVERPRFGIERKALPLLAGRPPKPELTGRSQGQAEYPVEMMLVPVPADADSDIVFGAKDLPDPGFGLAE